MADELNLTAYRGMLELGSRHQSSDIRLKKLWLSENDGKQTQEKGATYCT
jgi:hypothetical protein